MKDYLCLAGQNPCSGKVYTEFTILVTVHQSTSLIALAQTKWLDVQTGHPVVQDVNC